jgi:hypothetical protein
MRFARDLGILSLFVVLLGTTFTISSGCGSSGHLAISVLLSTAPPNSLQTGANAPVAATVTNDSANKGVTWSCMPAGACGSFNPAATASGAMTTFTAPQAVPQGGSVTIIATSVSDNTKTASATVTITAPPAIAVTFGNPAPPASINTSANAMIAANVANDPANKGVTWSCAPIGNCGSFVPAQTASGAATTFTAPNNTNNGTLLIITATSVADSTKSISANVALSAPTTVTVTITQFPAQQSIATGASVAFGATVSNDPANGGVNWTCSIAGGGACGTFAPTHTASGASTMYTAPAALPQSPQVTITATSVTNPTPPNGTASVLLTIFSPGTNNANLKGQYAFVLTGQVVSSNLPTVGSLTFDGNGNITAGEFDQPSLQTQANNFSAIPVTGTYSVSADGRGSMTLSFSINGTPGFQMSYNFALTSNSHAVLVETDGLVSASGSLDLQSAGPNFSQSQITGGYSFALTGMDNPNFTALARGGILTADGAGGHLTNGTLDTNDAGALASTAFTGTFTAPDSFGRGTFTFSNGSLFTYYIVTPGVLRLVETDSNSFTTGGSAYGQGSLATAGNDTNAALTGSFVFGMLGQSSGMGTATVGQFTTDANGTFTAGRADSVSGDGATVNTAVSLTGTTYSISGSPRGTVTGGGGSMFNIYLTDPKINLFDPNNANGGGGALIIENDATATTVGLVIPQANPANATFSGNYALNMTALQNQGLGVDFELDLSGAVTASSATAYSGLADYAGTAFNPSTNATLSEAPVAGSSLSNGSLAADVANPGHFTGSLTITPPAGTTYFIGQAATNATLSLSYYQVSTTQLLFIQVDGGEVAIGFLEQ